MRINNKSITGLFIYSKDATYERNDLVIVDNTIYVCSPSNNKTTVIGSNPKEDKENFHEYLLDKTASIEDCINFIETGQGENKIIDITTLQAVLNHFMIGINSKGIIGDCVEIDKTGKAVVIIDNEEVKDVDLNNILSYIFTNDKINNAIFKVSNNLPELSLYSLDPDGYCLLKQYTTLKTFGDDKIKSRVQELIDPLTGLIYIRSLDLITESESPGPFKCSVVKAYQIKHLLDNLLDKYQGRINYLRALEENLKNNFRNRQLLRNYSEDLTNIDLFLKDTTSNNYIGDTDYITVLLRKSTEDSSTFISESVSISLKESKNCSYLIFGGNNKLIIKVSEDNSRINITTDDTEKIVISEITYREYYGT